MTMGVISERLKSSRAAVRPAGPAPAMTAILRYLSLEGIGMRLSIRAAFDEKKLPACQEIPNEGKAGRPAFGDEVVQPKILTPKAMAAALIATPITPIAAKLANSMRGSRSRRYLNTKVTDST